MTSATVWTYRRRDLLRNTKVVFMKMPCISGDTSAVFPTQLKKIYSYSVSSPTTAEKYVTRGVISGGTITLTITDPTEAATLYLTAYGI
jgi:hypothetical protein